MAAAVDVTEAGGLAVAMVAAMVEETMEAGMGMMRWRGDGEEVMGEVAPVGRGRWGAWWRWRRRRR